MEPFIDELDSGEVHIRDRWQLELKSEFFPQSDVNNSEYVQEFYFFIPNSLQINKLSYTKGQFYTDQTNLIRYKTPLFSFADLLNQHDPKSPLTRISTLIHSSEADRAALLSDELKLFGNVVRSALRERVKLLIQELSLGKNKESKQDFSSQAILLCQDIQALRRAFSATQKEHNRFYNEIPGQPVKGPSTHLLSEQFLYVDEFISRSIVYYLTGLLEHMRQAPHPSLSTSDQNICRLILEEQQICDHYLHSEKASPHQVSLSENEQILYRSSLLNKFILDALLLHTNRFTIEQKYQHWIAGFAAGIAMLIYFSLFIWLGNVFVWNSLPFILFTVVIYILKDRIKEGIKNISYTHAFKWFSDFGTFIYSPDKKHNIGIIKETFSFVSENQLTPEIQKARNIDFHEVLENFQRPETVILYKRSVCIHNLKGRQSRRYGLNIIFRFNIHRFLRKAGNPSETHYELEPQTLQLQNLKLPKVYHLDLIIRNTTKQPNKTAHTHLKKLRVIIDKNGIKRIEQVIPRKPPD